MPQKIKLQLEEMAGVMMEIANRTILMNWLEKSFLKVAESGGQTRTLLAVTFKECCSKEELAQIIKTNPHTAYQYLQKLEKKS